MNSPTIKQSLDALFSAFPASDSHDPKSTVMAYRMAVEDYDPADVADAVKRFIKGAVPRERHTFLPSTAELAREAGARMEMRNLRASRARQVPAPKAAMLERPAIGPDEREKVAAMMAKLADDLAAKGVITRS